MSKKWNEEEIKQQLQNMPEIKDHRSSKDILHRLKADSRVQKNIKQQKQSFPWIPTVATIASILLISLLLPLMMKMNGSSADKASSASYEMKRDFDDSATEESSSMADEDHATKESALFSDDEAAIDHESYVVLPGEVLENMTLLNIGFVSNEQVIPVSLLIPNEKVQEKFSNETPNDVDLYTRFLAEVDEELLGFTPYHPYDGTLSLQGDQVNHKIDNDSVYLEQNGEFLLYLKTIKETFPTHSELQITTNKDRIAKTYNLTSDGEVSSYYQYRLPSGATYLVKEESAGTTIVDALKNMTVSPNENVAIIPLHNLPYEIQLEGDVATIHFTKTVDLSLMDYEEALMFIEGFMLTASHFNKHIQFQNIQPMTFGKYDFENPLPIPVGSNPSRYFLD